MGTQTDRQTDRDQQTGRQSRRRESCSTGSQHCGWCLPVCLSVCLPAGLYLSLCCCISAHSAATAHSAAVCRHDERRARNEDERRCCLPIYEIPPNPSKKLHSASPPLSTHTLSHSFIQSATHSSSHSTLMHRACLQPRAGCALHLTRISAKEQGAVDCRLGLLGSAGCSCWCC